MPDHPKTGRATLPEQSSRRANHERRCAEGWDGDADEIYWFHFWAADGSTRDLEHQTANSSENRKPVRPVPELSSGLLECPWGCEWRIVALGVRMQIYSMLRLGSCGGHGVSGVRASSPGHQGILPLTARPE